MNVYQEKIKKEGAMKIIVIFLLLILSLLFVNGCAVILAGSAGAGTVAYIKGELQTNLEAPLEKSIEATNRAIGNLKFIIISKEVDKLAGEIIARTTQDQKITIKLNKVTENTTKISIRVGIFGDQTLSRNVLDEIKKEL